MNKKMMLLAAGALAALAFAALPAVASAGEFPIHCEGGGVCTDTVAGGAIEIANTAGERISCSSVTGTTSQNNEATTGTAQLKFHTCHETISGFKFTCTTAGQPSGTITTNVMTTHTVYIEPNKGTPGILFTGVNMTTTCAGFISKTFTGSIIGKFEAPNCGVTQASHTIVFEKSALGNGHQTPNQVTTTGTVYDLISGSHSNDTATTSLTGTTTLTHAKKTALTC